MNDQENMADAVLVLREYARVGLLQMEPTLTKEQTELGNIVKYDNKGYIFDSMDATIILAYYAYHDVLCFTDYENIEEFSMAYAEGKLSVK